MKIDKKSWSFATFAEADKADAEDLSKLTYQQKSSTITYLRECFYGRQATTGRVQRIFEVSKQK